MSWKGRQRCRRGCVLAFFFLKRKSFGQRTRMKRGTLRGKGAGPRPLSRAGRWPALPNSTGCQWSTGASLREKTILTDRKNRGQWQQLLCQQGSQCLLPVSQGETSARVGKFPENFKL